MKYKITLCLGACAILALFVIPAGVAAQDRSFAKDMEMLPDEDFELLLDVIDSHSAHTSQQSLNNPVREFLECARAMTCVRCFGSLESGCVEFNLNNWLWCANPLNSVLLKCHAAAL